MEIKNIGALGQVNDAKTKTGKHEDIAVSFQEFLQKRLQPQSVTQTADSGVSVESLYGMSEIEAVAARSRIVQDTGGDVTDFLELVKKQPYLLGGADFTGLNNAAITAKSINQQDLQRLREKYDTDNLPPEQQYELFQELTGLGVLTKDDAQKTQLSVSPDEDDLMGYLADEPGFRDVLSIDAANPKARLDAMIHNERFTYDHVRQRYGKHADSVSALADSHQKVLDTLNQI